MNTAIANNLGTSLIFAGEYKRAEEKLKKALNMEANILGQNHYLVASTYQNLGAFQVMIGSWTEADQNLEKALEIEESRFGSEHIASLGTYSAYALLHISQHRFQTGQDYIERARKILRRHRAKRRAM